MLYSRCAENIEHFEAVPKRKRPGFSGVERLPSLRASTLVLAAKRTVNWVVVGTHFTMASFSTQGLLAGFIATAVPAGGPEERDFSIRKYKLFENRRLYLFPANLIGVHDTGDSARRSRE